MNLTCAGIAGVLSTLFVVTAEAQRLELGLGQIVTAGDEVHSGCDQQTHSSGLGIGMAVPITRKVLSVAATGRVYPVGTGPTCVTDIFVPQNGTFIRDNRVELQGTHFLTSDVRLQVSPMTPLVVAVGGGIAWHPGPDFPYIVAATLGRFPSIGRIQFLVGAEYYFVRTSWNEWSVTYANSVPVNTVPLGRRQKWASALGLSASVSLQL